MRNAGDMEMANIITTGVITFCVFTIVVSYITYKEMKEKHEQFMETYKKQAEHYKARGEEFKQKIEEFEKNQHKKYKSKQK